MTGVTKRAKGRRDASGSGSGSGGRASGDGSGDDTGSEHRVEGADADGDVDEGEDEDEEKTVVNLAEQPAVRHCMDDMAARTMLDYGFEEDHSSSNKKLAVGLLACVAVAVSHFAPVPFPDSIPLLWACIAAYSACALYLQYVFFFVEGDTLLRSKEKKRGLQPMQYFPATLFRAEMGRFEPEYRLVAELVDKEAFGEVEEELKLTATDYFDSNGAFYHREFSDAVLGLCERIHKRAVDKRPKTE